jgi:hypothetical protein
MLTTTGSLEVGAVGVWPVTFTETGGAEVFITAIVRGKFGL